MGDLGSKISYLTMELIRMTSQLLQEVKILNQAFHERDQESAALAASRCAAFAKELRQFEQDCLKTLATFQPVATDLKQIIALFKINQDLERMNAMTQKIGKKTQKLAKETSIAIPFAFREQFSLVERTLYRCIQLIHSQEKSLTSEVHQYREEGEVLKHSMKKVIEAEIERQPGKSDALMTMYAISRHLYRISGLAEMICTEFVPNRNYGDA